MVDSTNIYDEPNADLVLYYCDGNFAVSEAAVRARFPNAILVPCSAIGTNSGIVGDCEPGCMTEDQLVDWVLMRRAAGVDPTGYVNEMHGWVPAKATFARRGVPEPHWGVADYDAVDVIPAGAVFKQDKNSAMTGGHFDQSIVVDFWPGVDNAFGPGGASIGEEDLTPDEHTWLKAVYDVLSPVSLSQIQTEVIQVQNLLEHGTDASAGNPGSIKIPTTAELLTAIQAVSTSGSGLTQQQITDAVTAALKGLTLKAQ